MPSQPHPLARALALGKTQQSPAWMGRLGETWPAKLAQTLAGAVMEPGRVMREGVDDSSIDRMADLAGFMTGTPGGIGGLGSGARVAGRAATHLPMDDASRLARARQLGFDVDEPLYHGTGQSFDQFDLAKAGSKSGSEAQAGMYLSPDPSEASHYAAVAAVRDIRPGDGPAHSMLAGHPVVYDGGNVMPTYIKPGRQMVVDTVEGSNRDGRNFYNTAAFESIVAKAKKDGYDTVRIKNVDEGRGPIDQIVILNPANVRSRWATFDPEKSGSADILAAGGNPIAGGIPIAGSGGEAQAGPQRHPLAVALAKGK